MPYISSHPGRNESEGEAPAVSRQLIPAVAELATKGTRRDGTRRDGSTFGWQSKEHKDRRRSGGRGRKMRTSARAADCLVFHLLLERDAAASFTTYERRLKRRAYKPKKFLLPLRPPSVTACSLWTA